MKLDGTVLGFDVGSRRIGVAIGRAFSVGARALAMVDVRADGPDWHALDAAYLAHHFNCPTCIAAGRGSRYGLRCGTGAALWRAYSEAQLPGPQYSNSTPTKG